MKHVEYLGFQGSVSYEDGLLLVQILHISDFVVGECDSASTVGNVFKELVDEYVADCKVLGRKPNKPFKGTFNVRILPEQHREAVSSATRHEQSLNTWVSDAITGKLADERNDTSKKIIEEYSEKLQELSLMPAQRLIQSFGVFEVNLLSLDKRTEPDTADNVEEMTKKLFEAANFRPRRDAMQ